MDRGSLFATYAGLELKGAIAARGWTATAVAQATSHSPAALSRWLSGQKTLPMPVLLEACDVIGADPREIVERAYSRLPPAAEEAAPTGVADLAAWGVAAQVTDADPLEEADAVYGIDPDAGEESQETPWDD